MSGNHDYPPASRRPPGSRAALERPRRSTQLQHLRDLLTSGGGDPISSVRALETFTQEIYDRRSDLERERAAFEQVDRPRWEVHPHGSRLSHMRPGMQRLPTMNAAAEGPSTNTPGSSRPPGFPRRRGVRGGHRSLQDGRNRDPTTHSILDEPVPLLETPTAMPRDMDGDDQMERWRVKRRKLESDDNREGLESFRYGHYGQVVPGTLKMELASCDGGTYEPEGECSWPENILRNDSSVYCTKSDRCNLILKHRGETPFCLKRIVIRAPKSGYDAPIQEGMVFVSMNSDELLARTAQHQIQNNSSRRHRRNRRSGMQLSQEYLNAYRTPLQILERAALGIPGSLEESDTDISDLARFNVDPNSNPASEFRITTDYDERPDRNRNADINLHDDFYSRLADIDWLQLNPADDDVLCSESDDSVSDDDGTTTGSSTSNRRRDDIERRMLVMRRHYAADQEDGPRRYPVPSTIQPTPTPTGQQQQQQEQQSSSDSRYPSSGLLKPHARFFIERSKSMVSIKFDPPPSGRFILIKLWSPHSGGNIDIQSVIAQGFAGPRYFPSGNFR